MRNQSDRAIRNGMDAPTLNGITVPKWRLRINHFTDRSVHHEGYNNWH